MASPGEKATLEEMASQKYAVTTVSSVAQATLPFPPALADKSHEFHLDVHRTGSTYAPGILVRGDPVLGGPVLEIPGIAKY
jgi:hypothetical protein